MEPSARVGIGARCLLVKHDTSIEEIIARRVAGETLADLRTVRREMREPGAVRGLVGERIRAALTRHRTHAAAQSPAA